MAVPHAPLDVGVLWYHHKPPLDSNIADRGVIWGWSVCAGLQLNVTVNHSCVWYIDQARYKRSH